MIAFSLSLAHAEDKVERYSVKAAFIFNFAKFVTWPSQVFESEKSPLVIGIIGSDPFGDSFEIFSGQTIQKRKVIVSHIENISEAQKCHIIFISDSGKKNLREILKSLKWSPVLTVSDVDGFCQEDGKINWIDMEERVGFEINNSPARQAGLTISSQLLKLARKIY
jgi:hypothetical protein